MSDIPVSTFLARVNARRGQGYIYGAYFSRIITEDYIASKARQFPNQYTASYIERSRRWIGHYAGDCMGLIKQAWWTDPAGKVVYGLSGRQDISANGCYSLASVKGPIETLPETPGLFLHKTGHIGVYLGGGKALESRGVDYGVVETDVAGRGWTHWGEIPYIAYTEAPPEPGDPDEDGAPDYVPPANTLDEGLELGPLVRNTPVTTAGLGELDIVIATTVGADTTTPAPGGIYDGVYSGIRFYCTTSADNANAWLAAFNNDGKKEAIVAVFMAPHKLVGAVEAVGLTAAGPVIRKFLITGPECPTTLDGYRPKNKKLLAYPFNFLYIHNNSGQTAIFRYEDFHGAPVFDLYGPVAPSPVYKLTPFNVHAATDPDEQALDQSLTISGFPVCAWSSDVYKNWIAQNSGSVVTQLTGGALSLGGGVAALAGATAAAAALPVTGVLAVAGGAVAIAGQLASLKAMDARPPQAEGQVNSGTANCAIHKNDFFIYGKSIRREYAEILDAFFELFGYKTMRVKVPNLSGRPWWNYVKTIDANIVGDVPTDDMARLRRIFDTGVTLWKHAEAIGDYSLDNHQGGV